jgi:hypothetical protein
MHTFASGEPLDACMAESSATMPGHSGMLTAEIRGSCKHHIDGRHMEIDVP